MPLTWFAPQHTFTQIMVHHHDSAQFTNSALKLWLNLLKRFWTLSMHNVAKCTQYPNIHDQQQILPANKLSSVIFTHKWWKNAGQKLQWTKSYVHCNSHHLFDVIAGLGTCFNKHYIQLLCLLLSFLSWHLPAQNTHSNTAWGSDTRKQIQKTQMVSAENPT